MTPKELKTKLMLTIMCTVKQVNNIQLSLGIELLTNSYFPNQAIEIIKVTKYHKLAF